MELVTSGQDAAAGASPSDQKELVAGCLRADSAAWEAMIRHHGPRIARLVQRYASLRAEVDDIKQEVFLKVFRKLRTFRADEGNLGGWISRIGRNLVCDHLRRSGPVLNACGSDDLEMLALRDHREPDPESAAIIKEASRRLRERMRFLSRDLAETLELRYLAEMKYDEIAEVLQVPTGTVRSRLKRGRDKLAGRR